MERLDLRRLEYFVAVAEELHFGRAAARLHLAQPSLSYQVRRLEDELGVTLLARSSRRVELTPAGQALMRDGRRTLTQARRAIAAVRAAGEECLTVGFGGSAASELLPHVLRAFSDRFPAIQVAVHELSLDGAADIIDGRVDIAFTRLEPGDVGAEVEVEVLQREPRVVALPVGHRLAGRASVSFADLREESFIANPVIQHAGPPPAWLAELQRHGLPRRVAAEATSLQETLTLVATERGVCLLPASAAKMHPRTDLRYIEVRDATPAPVSLAWHRPLDRPAVEAFVRTVREVVAISIRVDVNEHV